RDLLDALGDAPAVLRAGLQRAEHQHVEGALQQVHVFGRHPASLSLPLDDLQEDRETLVDCQEEARGTYYWTMDQAPLVLGIEGGGTKTEWVLAAGTPPSATFVAQGQLPAANLRSSSDESLLALLSQLRRDVTAVGVFLAGCGTEADRLRLRRLARTIWPQAAITVGSDRDSSLATCFLGADGIVVIAGTGSAVTGQRGGRVEKAGGRGHLLGDKGGAYDLVLEGLCA